MATSAKGGLAAMILAGKPQNRTNEDDDALEVATAQFLSASKSGNTKAAKAALKSFVDIYSGGSSEDDGD